jgi:hypothetical protein
MQIIHMYQSSHQIFFLVIFVVKLIRLFIFPLGIRIGNHTVSEITMKNSCPLQLVYLVII